MTKKLKQILALLLAVCILCPALLKPVPVYADEDHPWNGRIEELICVGGWQMGQLASAINNQYGGKDYRQHTWITGDYDADNCSALIDPIKGAVDSYVSEHGTGEGCAVILWFGSSRSFAKPYWWNNYPGTSTMPKDDSDEFEDSDSPHVVGLSGDQIFDTISYYHREPKYVKTVINTAEEVGEATTKAQEDWAATQYPDPSDDDGIVVEGEEDGGTVDDGTVDDGITINDDVPTFDLDYLIDNGYLELPDPSDDENWTDEEREHALEGEGDYRIDEETGDFVYDKFDGFEKICDWESAPRRYQNGLKEATMYATANKMKVYWMSVSTPRDYATLEDGQIQNKVIQFPNTKAYLGYDGSAKSMTEIDSNMRQHTNASVVMNWNDAMKGSTPSGAKFVDVYEPMRYNNPYFAGGDQASFSEQSSQTIWHIMWNTVQELNPGKEMGEAIDTSLYSISCALTAYVNGVLGVDATEDHTAHKAPVVTNMGNGGDYLGYGDKEYKFAEGLISYDSKVSSVISYNGLLDKDGDSHNYMYLYGRYGYLLYDLGLDSVARGTPKISSTMVPGSIMTFMYSASAMGGKVFNLFITALQYINPFQMLSKSTHLLPGVKTVFSGEYDGFDVGGTRNVGLKNAGGSGSGTTGATEFVEHENYTKPNQAWENVKKSVSAIYDGLDKIGWGVTIPLLFVFLIFSYFMRGKLWRNEKTGDPAFAQKLGAFLIRFAFIAFGIPIFGILYTHSLDYLEYFTDDSKLASTQIVSSTFVNFGDWAEKYRLAPLDDMTLVSSPTTSLSGEGSVNSFRNLRKTAVALNKATGSLPASYTSSFDTNFLSANSKWFTTEDAGKSDNVLWRKVLDILMAYSKDNRYYAADWESTMYSAATMDDSIEMGRRQGSLEEDFDEELYQGENTYYNLADSTNEYDDWNDRSDDENDEVTNGSSWTDFNIFSNGKIDVSNSGNGVENKTVKYTSGGHSRAMMSPSKKGGLSTLTLYNYLSSQFTSQEIKVFSNKLAANEVQKVSHRKYSVIGGPALSGLFFLNCVVVLMVGAILGLVYGISMLMNNVKRSIQVLASIPGLSLGALGSIGSFVVGVTNMIANVMLTIFLYSIFSDLTLFIVNIMEGMLRDAGVNGTILGGLPMQQVLHADVVSILSQTKVGVGVSLVGVLVFVGLIGLYLWGYRREILPACFAVQEKILLIGLPLAVKEEALRRWSAPVSQPVFTPGFVFSNLRNEFLYDLRITDVAKI